MRDPRVAKLAELVIGYSLELKPGNVIRLDGSEVAAPLVLELYRAALAQGGLPYTNVALEGLAELVVEEGTEEQLIYISPIQRREVERIDALVTLWSTANTRSFTRADADRHQRFLGARRELVNRLWDRIAAGEVTWCGTLFPTNAHAQDAEMSLPEYEEFVYGACHVRESEDPVAHWRQIAADLRARASSMASVRGLRIVGPDTDLRIGVEGRKWLTAEGRHNLPDGEVFTSPVEEATEGEVRFTFPAIYGNREVEDVRLRFEGGRVVHAEAARGEEYLRSLLAMDDEASVLGEFAFGLNYEIDRFTRNILFDEKIGGTVHVALGAGFPEAGGKNRSGLHWDMICDLREEGEIYADGEVIWRAGAFIGEPAQAEVAAAPAAAS